VQGGDPLIDHRLFGSAIDEPMKLLGHSSVSGP
jgi:hypothetical protein